MTKIQTLLLAGLLAFNFSHSSLAEEKGTSEKSELAISRPNGISVELLGRSVLYSLQYDRMLEDNVGVGIGFSSVSVGAGTVSASLTMFPLFVNYYFAKEQNHFFATGGTNFLIGSGTISGLSVSATGVGLFDIGVGYEHRGSFLFRVTPQVIIGSGSILPWIGLSFGTAF